MDKSDVMHMPLDPNRPMLEQMEERAMQEAELGNDRDLKLLEKKIYRNPERMSLLTGVNSTKPKK